MKKPALGGLPGTDKDHITVGAADGIPIRTPAQTAAHTWLAHVEGRTLRIFSPTPATHDEIMHQLGLRFPGAAVRVQAVGS